MPAANTTPPARPDFHVHTPLPATVWKNDWTKAEVDDALRNHELGQFMSTALLADAMTRDDTFDAVLGTRVLGMLGLPRVVGPSHEADPRRSKKVARAIDDRFDTIFPRSTLAELLRWGILLGFALAQIVWRADDDGTEWTPELQVWHPSFVYYRHDVRAYFALTTDGPVRIEPGNGQWLLYTPFGTDRGWMSGAVRSVSIPWLARSYTWRDWQRWSELYSMGVRKAIAPANADEGDKERFFNQVAALGSETTVLLTQALSGEKFDLEVVWPDTSGSADGFERLMNKCESRIAIRVLGQNLTTEVQSGSLAAARVHENVKADIIQFDARTLAEDLRAQVLRPYCRFNVPGGERFAPRLGWRTTPTEDRKNEADTALAAAQALAALLQSGVPLDVRAYAQRFGLPLTAPVGDDASGPPVPPTPSTQPIGSATASPRASTSRVARWRA